jgi:hypothetical protein
VGWFSKTGLLLHFPINVNHAARFCIEEPYKEIMFMYLGGNAVTDPFQPPTSVGRGHIGKDTDQNVYLSLLFIISLSDHLRPQSVHAMAGENTFNDMIAILPDVIPEGPLIDMSESVLLSVLTRRSERIERNSGREFTRRLRIIQIGRNPWAKSIDIDQKNIKLDQLERTQLKPRLASQVDHE